MSSLLILPYIGMPANETCLFVWMYPSRVGVLMIDKI
jgi:hypothetical protein